MFVTEHEAGHKQLVLLLCRNCNNTNLLAFFKPPKKPQQTLSIYRKISNNIVVVYCNRIAVTHILSSQNNPTLRKLLWIEKHTNGVVIFW